ncbi:MULTISPECIES: patatin-like phospholipase family protein [unclassified Brevundimonas]|uniref:patatin-like phospholipase family protein n=1 Tax=unclassified Brevundimonas TaxID=2622653 RepID=UPI0025C1CD2F|nr:MULTISPECIES: patatin-like phospholipase family protein [unclassified Brevundimonas]
MAHPTRDSLDSALARILTEKPDPRASWFALTEGDRLFSAGDPADTFYVLQSGRLGVFIPREGQPSEFIGIVHPGTPVGEMAMLADTAHTANVVALRDSEVIALPREAFYELSRSHPDLMAEVARVMIRRNRQKGSNDFPTAHGFVAARAQPIRPFVEAIHAAIEAEGYRVRIIDRDATTLAADWFARIEDAHDFVLYVAEADEPAWANLCARQVDRLFIVGDPENAPPAKATKRNGDSELVQQLTDLILLSKTPVGQRHPCKPWLDAMSPGRWFHCQDGSAHDAHRMARVITGASVGLVLSGGGARAYAHIGVLRALNDAKIPVDFLGGSSMGGIIAAGPALGWTQEELEARIHDVFVRKDPLSDIALPLVALTRANKLQNLLQEAYGDLAIEDMPLPFFAVSANLTTGRIEVHREGLLREALRASVAIPGLIPPFVRNGQVLVDGAVLRNFPSDVMRRFNRGPMIGSDVSQTRGVNAEQLENPPSWWRWIMSGAWKQGPPIVSVLMRAATLSTSAELAEARAETDVLIMPRPEGIDIREWKAFEPTVAAGEMAAKAALAQIDRPIADLRRPAPKPVVAAPEISIEAAVASPVRAALARLLPQRKPPQTVDHR